MSNYASPVASPGPNQAVLVGSGTVTLDASGSSQADGHTLTYLWAQTGGHAGDAVGCDGDHADVHGAERGLDVEVHA